MANSIIFSDNNLPVAQTSATIIKYNLFSAIQTNTVLWTPATGKKIYLTSIVTSSLITLNVNFERASNVVFLVGSITALAPLPYVVSFFSPIRFNTNESISVTTSAIGAVNITLMGYEF